MKKALTLAAMVLAGCGYLKDINDEQFSRIQRVYGLEIPRTEAENIYDSTVEVELSFGNKTFGGTGTVLRNSNPEEFYVLTAAHIVQPFKNHEVHGKLTSDGMRSEQIKYRFSKFLGIDLALLKVRGSLPYFQGKIAKKVNKKDSLFCVGYPIYMPKEVFLGPFSRDSDEYALAVSFPKIQEGVSGAGVFNRTNHFQYVGMVTGVPEFKEAFPKNTMLIQRLDIVREFLKDTPLEDEYL